MQATLNLTTTIDDDPEAFVAGLLAGHRFRIARSAKEWEAGLAVRRQVYGNTCGYAVPVPDQYDTRSWLLIAEDTTTGKVVGTMRVTPRAAGPLEAEEYFTLPLPLQRPDALEMTRFAILPEYRKGKTFLPIVSLGLFKLVHELLVRLGCRHLVLCSKPERVWTYEWMRFRHTGLTARYEKLAGAAHELLSLDYKSWLETVDDHPFCGFFRDFHYDEVELPRQLPALGQPARTERRVAVGA
jgi:N-acyl-L-homoserine lactone synthetase